MGSDDDNSSSLQGKEGAGGGGGAGIAGRFVYTVEESQGYETSSTGRSSVL